MDTLPCLLVIVATLLGAAHGQPSFTVKVDTSSSNYTTDMKYLSVTLNTIIFHRTGRFDVNSERVKNLARGLTPVTLRIGGVRAGMMFFQNSDGSLSLSDENIKQWEDFFGVPLWDQQLTSWGGNWNLTGPEWSVIMDWVKEVGWDAIFNLNQFVWDKNHIWDPINARQLLKYSASQGYDLEGFQIFNEPDGHDSKFGIWVTPEQAVRDIKSLRQFLDTELTRYTPAKLYAPDVTSFSRSWSARDYLKKFLAAGGAQFLDVLTWHHYYFNGRTVQLGEYFNTDAFDKLILGFQYLSQILEEYGGSHLPIVLSESADAYSGGARNLSNAFCGTPIYLDELGLAAKNGIMRINKQDFYSGYYGMLDERSLEPNPTYWLALLYKRLVLGAVFDVTFDPPDGDVRLYAHCARTDFYNFRDGSIVVYYINTKKTPVRITLPQYKDYGYLLYQLTSIDGTKDSALKKNFIKLNGKTIKMDGDKLPDLKPVGQVGGRIRLDGYSLGFIVINSARVDLCVPQNV